MNKIFSFSHRLKNFSLLGVILLSLFVVTISYGMRYTTKKRMDKKNYLRLQETVSQVFISPQTPSLAVTELIEKTLEKYPSLSQEYQNPLINLYLIQGNKKKALELLHNTHLPIEASLEQEILAINNEATRWCIENNFEAALQQSLALNTLLKKHQEKFPVLFSLNLFRLFSLSRQLDIRDNSFMIQELIKDPTSNKIFQLFSEGEYSIKEFLKI